MGFATLVLVSVLNGGVYAAAAQLIVRSLTLAARILAMTGPYRKDETLHPLLKLTHPMQILCI